MPLAAGTKLDHYEVISMLGMGGMGEVYRARDTRLRREVAIKVLPAQFSIDPDRLRRFEEEACTAAGLNHPNILAVHDVGIYERSPYFVSELLEGKTLREHLRDGPLSPSKAIDCARQIAMGLAAAHQRGILHCDLKPENVYITNEGLVRILDFGLAKLICPETDIQALTQSSAPTLPISSGGIWGTVDYMSPEQLRGLPVDQRSDIFSFGAVLYEMLCDRRPFQRASTADTISAILKEDPPELSGRQPQIAPALERIVRHCLEKNPAERFQSARDIAFDLAALANVSGRDAIETGVSQTRTSSHLLLFSAALILALFAAALGVLLGKELWRANTPQYYRLTFRRGDIGNARFAADEDTIVYSALWDGGAIEVFSTRAGAVESRTLDLGSSDVLAVSHSGEIAVGLRSRQSGNFNRICTLARVPLAGGVPREMLEGVEWADWAPDGNSLAVVRTVRGRDRLEFPIGKALYETSGWISNPRISPKANLIAFIDHPAQGQHAGSVELVDGVGRRRTLSLGWTRAEGLGWSPDGKEVWITATRTGSTDALYAVNLSGQERLIIRAPINLTLHDVGRNGRVLLSRDEARVSIYGFAPGATKERDLSWLDSSIPTDLSPDGKTLLFTESGEGAGPGYAGYVRQTNGSPAIRLGQGAALALSPDGSLALTSVPNAPGQVAVTPLKTGQWKQITDDRIVRVWANWLPDGKRFVSLGSELGRGLRLYVQDLAGGNPQPISPEGVVGGTYSIPVSRDGRFAAGIGADQKLYLYPTSGASPISVSSAQPGDIPAALSADDRWLYIYRRGEPPFKIYRLNLQTNTRSEWKQLVPSDPAGLYLVGPILLTPDGNNYVYGCARIISALYLVEGLR